MWMGVGEEAWEWGAEAVSEVSHAVLEPGAGEVGAAEGGGEAEGR
jgi:hypothetical protein